MKLPELVHKYYCLGWGWSRRCHRNLLYSVYMRCRCWQVILRYDKRSWKNFQKHWPAPSSSELHRGNWDFEKGRGLSKATQLGGSGTRVRLWLPRFPIFFHAVSKAPSQHLWVQFKNRYHDQQRWLGMNLRKTPEAGQKPIFTTWWITWMSPRASFSKTKTGHLLDLEQQKLHWITR